MKTFKFLMPFLLVAFALVGCDTDDLRNDIDELKNRVESLEAQVSAINDNVNALKVFADGGKTISSYEETESGYKLVLSDNTVLNITQGQPGQVDVPEITIKDGYWYIEGQNTGMRAVGDDASLPQFTIKEYTPEGGTTGYYWYVGDELVRDDSGKPVLATTSDDVTIEQDFFESVKVDDTTSEMVLVLKNSDGTAGAEYRLPIVEGLKCAINTENLEDYKDGVLTMGFGAKLLIEVEISGGTYILTAPAGWGAELTEPQDGKATLTLTAPASASASTLSRAVADNTKDVVIQVNKGVNWAVDKIQVKAENIVTSYYSLYEGGENIVIEGVTINKATFGEATLVENDMSIVDDKAYGVYFVRPGVTLSYDVTNKTSSKHLIVIGDNENDNTAVFKLNQRIQTNMTSEPTDIDGYYIWNNIKFDASGLASQVFVAYRNGEQDKKILFNYCMMDLPAKNFFELTTDGRYFKDMVIKNSRIKLKGNMFLINLGEKNKSTSFGNLTMENNIFYTPNQTTTLNSFKILNTGNGVDAQLSNFVINNNTFINIAPNWSGMYYQAKLASVNMENNLFWYGAALTENAIVLRPVANPTSVKCLSNVGFSLTGEKRWVAAFGEINNWDAAAEEITNLYGASLDDSNNPFNGGEMNFETGTFIPNSNYSAYGAKFE